jgi:hypothetical protein
MLHFSYKKPVQIFRKCFLPAKPCELQTSQAHRVFRNGYAKEREVRATSDSRSIYANAKTKAQDRRGDRNEQSRRSPSRNVFSRVVDLLVEHRIKLDALEHVLRETNPLVHEFYPGTIENLRAQKAAELKKALTVRLKSQLSEG